MALQPNVRSDCCINHDGKHSIAGDSVFGTLEEAVRHDESHDLESSGKALRKTGLSLPISPRPDALRWAFRDKSRSSIAAARQVIQVV